MPALLVRRYQDRELLKEAFIITVIRNHLNAFKLMT